MRKLLLLTVLVAFILPKLHAQCSGTVLSIAATTPSQAGTTGTWTVPSGEPYKVRVTAKGGKGGNGSSGAPNTLGGKGATMTGDFLVSGGQTLQAIAGAAGGNDNSGIGGGGGGGGTGVRFSTGEVLIIAGGGGGSSLIGFGNGATTAGNGNGGTGNTSGSGSAAGGGLGSSGSNGGTNGTGTPPTGGGGGYNATGGTARNGGAIGGGGGGGFGAGGGANVSSGGGGGGYSGGNGVFSGYASFGGGSINYGSNQNNTAGDNNGGGALTIECLGSATFSANISPTQPACGSTQGSLTIDLTGDNDGNTSGLEYAIVSGSSFTGIPAFAGITADPFNIASGFGTTGATGGNTYTVRVRLTYNPAIYTDQTYTLNATTIPGDPAVFGNNTWNVYAWNAGGASFTGNTGCWNTNYAGYYTDNSLDINTQNNWDQNASPSSATNYAGCAVQVDNMSFAAKRQGFTCGYYQLDIPGHDDGAQLWVNGNMVWSEDGYNPNTHTNVWTGWLSANDKVELKVTDGISGSFGKLHFNALAGNNGDPAVFGNNQWNVYAYNSGNGSIAGTDWNTNYAGYYTSSSQDVNTENDWGKFTSPSYAANYTGCSVGNDYHSYSAKRQGFNCGYYSLDIPTHDDAAQLFVNGSNVWEHDVCCDSHTNVWSGWLGASDKIEYRISEGIGESVARLRLNVVRFADTSVLNVSICPVQLPYSWNGNSYNSGGTYYAHFINADGCDSVAALNLIIYQTTSDTTVSACNKYSWNGINPTVSGTYTWHGTNAAGCDSTATLHLTILSIANTFSKTDASCYGSATGAIQIQVAKIGYVGTPPYTYRLGVTGLINSTINVFNNLKAGSYRAYVQDANGCIGVAAPIVVAQQAQVTATASPSNTSCYGVADGKITITNPAGYSPFMYKTGSGATLTALTLPNTTISNLRAGDYRIYLQDANGCTSPGIVAGVQQPADVVVSYTTTQPTCSNPKGSISLGLPGNATGTFKLNPGGNYTSQFLYTSLAAGTYYGYAKDAGGCTGRSAPIVLSPATGCTPFARVAATHVEGGKQSFEVSLSPNPSRSNFALRVYSAKNETVQLRVLDVNGKVVYTAKSQPEQAFTFGNELPNGLYMVEVRQGEEVKTVKAVKMRN